MIKTLFTTKINFISLILYILTILLNSLNNIGFGLFLISILFQFLLFPIIICLSIYDIIKNPNSNLFNLISLLLVAYLVELSYNSPVIISLLYVNSDIILYFIWLFFLLAILIIINKLIGNKFFKYSTLLILSFTLIFHQIISPFWIKNFKFTKNIITQEVGSTNKYCNIRTKECVETKIPRIYDKLEVLFQLPEPLFYASKGNKRIVIDRLNKSIVPNVDDIEYIGHADTEIYHLFKVRKNDKYGIYKFLISKSHPKPDNGEMIVPLIYDEIQIIKENFTDNKTNYELDKAAQEQYELWREREAIISGIIAKKSDLYDLYVETNSSKQTHHRSGVKLDFRLYCKNKKDIKYIGRIQYNNDRLKRHAKFKVDNQYIIFPIFGGNW